MAKGRISKRVFQENKARQIFRKTNIFYPLICTRTCAYQGVKNVCFLKNLACNTRFAKFTRDSLFCLHRLESGKKEFKEPMLAKLFFRTLLSKQIFTDPIFRNIYCHFLHDDFSLFNQFVCGNIIFRWNCSFVDRCS